MCVGFSLLIFVEAVSRDWRVNDWNAQFSYNRGIIATKE